MKFFKLASFVVGVSLLTGTYALAEKPQWKKSEKYEESKEYDESYEKYEREYKKEKEEKHKKEKKYKKQKELPYGLQKKVQSGKTLPPGWQKKIEKGEVIDHETLSHAKVIYSKEYPVQQGTKVYELENKVFRVMNATKEILEVFKK